MDEHQKLGRFSEYVVAVSADSWSTPHTAEEHAAACARMESWLDSHEPPSVCVWARPCNPGETPGVYGTLRDGLGVELLDDTTMPERVKALIDFARSWAERTAPGLN